MTDLVFDDPCVLFALSWESAPFRRLFRPQQAFPGAPCWARFCGPEWLSVLVVHSGIGAARMEQALDWLLGGPRLEAVPYRPRLVFSAGFSGALQDGYRVGDLLLATEVVDETGTRWPATWPAEPLTGAWQPPLHRGRLLSTTALVATPEQKQSLGRRFEAAAVDMETGTVARRCHKARVPFGCLRVISDDLHTPLTPELLDLVAAQRIAPGRVLRALARRPRLAAELWQLGRQTRHAAGQLARALGELLTLTLPGGREG